jgi:hypothetical protein
MPAFRENCARINVGSYPVSLITEKQNKDGDCHGRVTNVFVDDVDVDDVHVDVEDVDVVDVDVEDVDVVMVEVVVLVVDVGR